jgi:hypothetical protein
MPKRASAVTPNRTRLTTLISALLLALCGAGILQSQNQSEIGREVAITLGDFLVNEVVFHD